MALVFATRTSTIDRERGTPPALPNCFLRIERGKRTA